MRPNMSVAQIDGKKIITICVPKNERHGRIDISFEFRSTEGQRAMSLQEILFENFLEIKENELQEN